MRGTTVPFGHLHCAFHRCLPMIGLRPIVKNFYKNCAQYAQPRKSSFMRFSRNPHYWLNSSSGGANLSIPVEGTPNGSQVYCTPPIIPGKAPFDPSGEVPFARLRKSTQWRERAGLKIMLGAFLSIPWGTPLSISREGRGSRGLLPNAVSEGCGP